MGLKDIFKKKGPEVLDLSTLQKRGILNKKIVKKADSSGIVDLSNSASNDSSALGFIGTLAGASADESSTNTIEANPASEAVEITSEGKTKLRGILRDMKSRIDSTYSKLYKVSDRLDLLEKKLERIERRVGVSES